MSNDAVGMVLQKNIIIIIIIQVCYEVILTYNSHHRSVPIRPRVSDLFDLSATRCLPQEGQ